jgi:hypothetical protein
MEPHDDGTSVLLLRHSLRIFCRIDKVADADEQSESCTADRYGRSRGASTGWAISLRRGDVGRAKAKHVLVSLPDDDLRPDHPRRAVWVLLKRDLSSKRKILCQVKR